MPKVYLSPSTQRATPCKQGDSEKNHCNLLVDALIPYLDACGILYRRAGADEVLASRVKASNAWHADLHYCIHTNAGGGRRSVLYGWDKTDADWLKLADAVKTHRAKIYPHEIRYAQKKTFYEIKQTAAKCMYDEVLFHDHAEDAAFLHQNLQPLARAIAQGLCDYFGIPFCEPSKQPAVEAPAESAQIASLTARLDAANQKLRQIAALATEV